ncbi:MAG TPA: hypothetical protein VF411_06300 [Bacteroidia bacterium]
MIPFQNPTIYFGALRIDEPISALTDILLCVVCFFAFFKTKNLAVHKAVNLYRWFFLFTGVSTLVAALIGHAFLYYFGFNAKMIGWVFGMLGVSFAVFASMYHTRPIIGNFAFKRLVLINSIEVVIAFIAVFLAWSFVVVEIHAAFGLLLNIAVLEYIHFQKTKSALSIRLLYGITIAIISVIAHIFTFASSVWFNHIDLSHVLMTLSIYVMYKGVSAYRKP